MSSQISRESGTLKVKVLQFGSWWKCWFIAIKKLLMMNGKLAETVLLEIFNFSVIVKFVVFIYFNDNFKEFQYWVTSKRQIVTYTKTAYSTKCNSHAYTVLIKIRYINFWLSKKIFKWHRMLLFLSMCCFVGIHAFTNSHKYIKTTQV